MIRVLLVFALALLAVAPKGKPLGTPSPASSPGAKQWNMKTDQLNANMATGRFSAPHHVLLVRSDGSTVDADRADGFVTVRAARPRRRAARRSGGVSPRR